MKLPTDGLLQLIRDGHPMTTGQRIRLVIFLSVPAVMANLTSIVMQYIDAAMVGHLGAEASASIGLVSTSTWLFGGLCGACATGFSVQVAHRIGAADMAGARDVLRQSLWATCIFGLLLGLTGSAISGPLPHWLGGDAGICRDSSIYFLIFSMTVPIWQMGLLAGAMLRCSGNMKVPSILSICMCVLDVIFNYLLIYVAGMGVAGAALGTAAAEIVVSAVMMWYLFRRSGTLSLKGRPGSFRPTAPVLRRAVRIGLPVGVEHALICGAQIASTVIVAPLGVCAIAANSFAVIAESLCYMPGYGISEAATTLVGQCIGAGRKLLTRSFARIAVLMGMGVMTAMGVLMYLFAPEMIGVMTPVAEIRDLGIMALRVEAFAEPMYAAAIVCYGAFVGAADTLIPCMMNVLSIWGVRITLAAWLAPSMGLKGVWIAMCIELCFRGIIFLWRLATGSWMKHKH